MNNELFESIKHLLPKDYKKLPWPKQREILRKIKKKIIKDRDSLFYEETASKPIEAKEEYLIPESSAKKELKILISGIDLDSKFIIVSFFTLNTPYEKEIKNLIVSLDKFNLCYYIEGIESLGEWVVNTQYKPVLIEKVLNLYKKPVICLDSDSIIKKDPKLFEELIETKIDFSAYFPNSIREKDKEFSPNINFLMDRLLSGTIYFNHTENAFKILKLWKEKCLMDRRTIDQNLLLECIKELKDEIKIRPLPLSYCQIYDIVRDKEDAVIEHYQASRRHRNTVRGGDNRKKKIAILTPSKKRPQGIKRLVESSYNTSSFPERIYYYFLISEEDKKSEEMINYLKKELTPNIYYEYEPKRKEEEDINYSKFWNLLYNKAYQKNIYCFGFFGDDVEFKTFSWDAMIVEEFKKNQGKPFMLRTNETGPNFRKNSTLFFTNKILHDILGRYLDEDYIQTYMDTDLHEICTKAGCFEFFKHILTYHHSIVLKRAPKDENYMDKLPNRKRIIDADNELFCSEKKVKEREKNILKIKKYIIGIK